MEKECEGVRNFSVAVTKRGDDIKFLHKIVEGGTDDSYGIEVAKLAGIPQKVINRAKEELKGLEVLGKTKLAETLENTAENQFSFSAINEQSREPVQLLCDKRAECNCKAPCGGYQFHVPDGCAAVRA